MEPVIGGVVKAKYDFQTEDDGELPLQIGDIIQVTKRVDRQWARGRIANRVGNFPVGFTVEVQVPAVPDRQHLFAVASDFTAQETGDLTIRKGDLIIGEHAIDENWWQGSINNQSGMFPVTHVWMLDQEILPKPPAPKKVFLQARVKMNMTAQLQEEMDLFKDDIVTIIEELEGGWYKGECNGRSGIFSSSFVTLLPSNTSNEFPNIVVSQSSNANQNHPAPQSSNQYGYDLLNSGISPYGRTLYKFQAEYENELSFNEGQLVNLTKHVDDNWMEGEIDGKIGCFPKNFIKIIVDCPSATEKCDKEKNATPVERETQFPPDTYGRVLSDFHPQLDGDVRLREGDTVTLLRKIDQDWYEVLTDNGEEGICPVSYIEVIGSGPETLPPSYFDVMSSTPSSYQSVSLNSSQNSSGDCSKLDRPLSYPPSSADTSFSSPRSDFSAGASSKSIDDKIEESLKGLDSALFSSNNNSFSSGRSRTSSFSNSFTSDDSSFSRANRDRSFVPPHHQLSRQCSLNVSDRRSGEWNAINNSFSDSNSTLKITSHNSFKDKTSNASAAPSRPPPPISSHSMLIPSRSSPSTVSMDGSAKANSSVSSHGSSDSLTEGSEQCDLKKQIEIKEQKIKKLNTFKVQRQNKNRGNDNTFISTEIEKEIKQFDSEIKDLERDIKSLKERLPVQTEERDEDRKRRDEEVARKRDDEQKRRNAEKVNKMKEQRECVITEIIQTEKDYLSDLKILQDTFLKCPEEARLKGVNLVTLFGNLEEVIELAGRLLSNLRQTARAGSNDQMIGQCFVNICDDMKEVYGHYCQYHDDVNSILDKFEDHSPAGQYLKHKLEVLKRQTNCFDLPSMLIKPVQRILKYPLLLNELFKFTEDKHPDKPSLRKAIDLMTDVATTINEFKRRKDLVLKYRKQANTSFSGKISKLNIHSMLKKSSRFGMRISSSIGLKSVTKDPEFDNIQQKFAALEKSLKIFLKDITDYSGIAEQQVSIALSMASDVAELYQERKSQKEVEEFQAAHKTISIQYWETFKQTIDQSVNSPIKRLLQTFEGPNNLIQKRFDKLLDYDSCTKRVEKNKDATKIKMLQDSQQLSKYNYEALNSQLLEDLPKLYSVSIEIFYDCIRCFLKAKKTFIGKTANEMLNLLELPLLLGSQGSSILETFQVKHTIVMDDLCQLSIVPKQFQSCIKTDSLRRNSSPRSSRLSFGSIHAANKSQNASQKTLIKSQYSESVLYTACETYNAVDLMDISIKKGDIVGVIKQQDPMGNKNRWFVDNGDNKGFVPAKILIKHLSSDEPLAATRRPLSQISITPSSSNSVDHRTQAQYTKPQKTVTKSSCRSSGVLVPSRPALVPSRPAPQVVRPPAPTHPVSTRTSPASNSTSNKIMPPVKPISDDVQHRYEEIDDLVPSEERYDTVPCDTMPFNEAPPPYESVPQNTTVALNEFDPYAAPMNASNLYDNVPDNANYLYDSQRYEEIPGDRYEVVNSDAQPEINEEYHYALYEFSPTGANQLSLRKGQVVLVLHKCDLKSNSEWWFVEDRHGNKGYVPSAYLSKYFQSITNS